MKEDYDGAEPSGNSVAALALLKLGAITDRADYKKAAEETLRLFGERLQNLPQAVPYMLLAFDFSLEEPKRVVIAGDPAQAGNARAAARGACGLSAGQSGAGQCGGGGGIREDAAGEGWGDGLSLHGNGVPAADAGGGEGEGNAGEVIIDLQTGHGQYGLKTPDNELV